MQQEQKSPEMILIGSGLDSATILHAAAVHGVSADRILVFNNSQDFVNFEMANGIEFKTSQIKTINLNFEAQIERYLEYSRQPLHTLPPDVLYPKDLTPSGYMNGAKLPNRHKQNNKRKNKKR